MQTHTHTYIHVVEYYTVFKMNEEALYILNLESSSIYIVVHIHNGVLLSH